MALSPQFFGLDLASDHFDSDDDWAAMQYAGAKMVHVQFNWQTVATGGGWANTYDKYIEKAVKHGQEILPYLYARKNGSKQYYLPSEWSEYLSTFVTEAVERYGYNGTFWSSHPDLPYRPIWVWEVWNEPNFNVNSPGEKANGATYAQFLKAVSSTIKSVQNLREPKPHTTLILFGGLYQPDRGIKPATFLAQANSIGGINAYYDGLGLHPYGFEGSSEVAKLKSVKKNVNEARVALSGMCAACTGKSLWLTELGWGVGGTGPVVTESEQAGLLTGSFDWLKEVSASMNIQYVAWYFYRDTGCCGTWDQYAGLRRMNGSERPAWCAYRISAIGSCPSLAGPNPDLASWDTNRLDIVARGADDALWQKWWNGASWSSWWNHGISTTSAPSAVSWGPNRLDIFAKAPTGGLHQRWWNGTSWSSWNHGGYLTSAPSAVSWGPGRVDVVARVADNSIQQWWWDGSWHTFNHGGSTTSAPVIVSRGPNSLDIFARGSDNALWQRSWNGTSWSSWDHGGYLTSAPSAVSWGPGRVDVVARVADNSIQQWWWDGSWHTFNHGGYFTSSPSIASWGPGRLDIFARDSQNALRQKWWEGASWSPWWNHGSSLVSAPRAKSWKPGRVDVVARVADNSIQQWWWDGSWHTFNHGGSFGGE